MSEHDIPRTVFVGIGGTGVAWYRIALPAMYLDCDWLGAAGEPPNVHFITGLAAEPKALDDLASYEVVVLQQPTGDAWLGKIRELQAAGVTVLYDIDDYVHGVRKQPDHQQAKSEAFGIAGLRRYEVCMAACDGLIVSTPWLAERYRHFNPRVWVCRNGLDLGRYNLTRPRRAGVAIGWSGAAGHVKGALPWLTEVAKVMDARPEARFVSVGQPFANSFIPRFGRERALAVGFAPLDTYPSAMTMFDIALAPAGRTQFYRGKSDLRWLEASALGIPVIADPGVYPDIEHGVTGFHAATPSEARGLMLQLVDDAPLRERVGEAARTHVRAHRDMRVMAGQWAQALREAVGSSAPAASGPTGVAYSPPAVVEVEERNSAASERLSGASGGVSVSTPRVSVIIPAYNYGRFLTQAIDSALDQTHPSFEVVVVDDGSTDETPEVIARYGDRIRAIRQDNAGANAAVTAGIEIAQGDFLTFLGADDFWPLDRLQRLADALDANPDAGLVWGDMAMVDADGAILTPSMRRAGMLPVCRGRVLGRLMQGNFISGGAMMVRSSLRHLFHPIPEHGGYEDWWIASRVASVADVEPVDGVVHYYRMHGDNMNLNATGDRLRKLLELELPFRRWLLTTTEASLVTPTELAGGLAAHDRIARKLAAVDPACAHTLLAPDRSATMRAMHEASEAMDAENLPLAHMWLVRAAVHDVTDPSPRALLTELIPLVTPAVVAASDVSSV